MNGSEIETAGEDMVRVVIADVPQKVLDLIEAEILIVLPSKTAIHPETIATEGIAQEVIRPREIVIRREILQEICSLAVMHPSVAT